MTTQTEEKKRSVKFKDEDGQSFIVTVEITHRNGYPEFTASGDYGGGGGQCDGHIKPKNKAQKKLLVIWNRWHLNGMNAGTKKQDAILKAYQEKTKERCDYDKSIEILKAHKINGEALTVIEAEGIKGMTAKIQRKILKTKEAIKKLSDAVTELKEHQKMLSGGSWIKVPSIVLTFPTKGKKVIKENYKFYDNRFQINTDQKKVEKLIKLENDYLKKVEKEELNSLLLSTAHHDIHPETGEVYQYGCGWIQEKLPVNFWEQLQVVLNQIEETEQEEHADEKKLSDFDFKTFGPEESAVFERFEEQHNDAEKVLALGISEDLTIEEALNEIEVSAHDECTLEYAGTTYLVGDDEDMDEKWDEDLENYIDECILHELPGQYQQYFDNEAWKVDARRDGRGHSLNRYDGTEECQDINGVEYFIYRQ